MSLKTHNFEFGEFCLETNERILLRQGKPVSLTPKALQLLFILVENHGRIVEKDDLIQAIWSDSFVEESNLTFTVSLLRKALNDNKQNSRFIETVSKRGYRFVGEVREIPIKYELAEESSIKTVSEEKNNRKNLFAVLAIGVLLFLTIALGFWIIKTKTFASNAPVLNEPFALEKLSTDGKVFNAVISPDGKNIVYSVGAGYENKSIWLRQLETGNNVEIVAPGDFTYHGFAFSPDGMFVYFHRRPSKSKESSSIYRVSILGGVPTKIVDISDGKVDFSPDGNRIVFFRCSFTQEENCSVWVADAADGKNEQKILALQSPNRISDAIFSTDGNSIIFASGQSLNAANEFGLTEINLQTGIEREYISEKFFDIIKIARLRDADGLLITASKSPNKNFPIWFVSVSKNEATVLTKDSESYFSISLDNESKMIVSTQVKPNFQLEFSQTDTSSTSPQVLVNATTAAFAPNGKLVYSSTMSGNDEIWSIQPDGTERKQLTNNPADETSPVVSPDNNSIFFASNQTGQVHVWRMNFDGTNQTQITQKEGGFPLFVSPDGKWVYYHHGLKRTLWKVSIQDNQLTETQVLKQQKPYFAISSDEKLVAYTEDRGAENIIQILNLDSPEKPIKSIGTAVLEWQVTDLKWMPDNKSLVYLLKNPENQAKTLWQQSLNEEKPRKIIDLDSQSIPHLSISPDGKNFGIIRGKWQHDAVLLKGLK